MVRLRKDPVGIRWHARGGQGAVTSSKILAEAANLEDNYFLGMPDYGAERAGAAMRSFTKVSSKPLRDLSEIAEPDAVVVLDATLLDEVDVVAGLKADGALVINTTEPPSDIRAKLGYKGKIIIVDATSISMETMGRNIPNIAMLGALAQAVEVVSKENLVKMIKESLGGKFKKAVVEANVTAFEKAYKTAQAG